MTNKLPENMYAKEPSILTEMQANAKQTIKSSMNIEQDENVSSIHYMESYQDDYGCTQPVTPVKHAWRIRSS